MTVAATGELGGAYSIPIRVIDPQAPRAETVLYDFKKANTYGGDKIKAMEFKSYNTSAHGADEEINPDAENTWGASYGPWKFYSWYDDIIGDAFFGFNSAEYGLYMRRKNQSSLRIIVPESGRYKISAFIGLRTDGGDTEISLAPVGENGLPGRQQLLGVMNNKAATNAYGVRRDLDGIFEIQAGEYILEFRNRTVSTFIVDGVLLRGLELAIDLPRLAVAQNKTTAIQIPVLDGGGKRGGYDRSHSGNSTVRPRGCGDDRSVGEPGADSSGDRQKERRYQGEPAGDHRRPQKRRSGDRRIRQPCGRSGLRGFVL